MLKDTQEGTSTQVFKCVGCGRTVAARNVEGTCPLDIEQQADDLYHHAADVLREQVCNPGT